MATEKEKVLSSILVNLAMEVNDGGKVNVSVDVRHFGVEMRISPVPFENEWIYYPQIPAYFSGDVFSEDQFVDTANIFLTEAKKHHPAFDADGVKL